MPRRIITHQVNGKDSQFEIMSVLTVERLVEMGILKHEGSSEVKYPEEGLVIEVNSYRKA